MYLKFKI